MELCSEFNILNLNLGQTNFFFPNDDLKIVYVFISNLPKFALV